MLLTVSQRSDQLRMHHKTLQDGDVNGYQTNLTFYVGENSNEAQESEPKSQIFNVAFGLSDYQASSGNIENNTFG